MTDLDDLKDAMHSPPDFEPRPLDLGAVMAQGSRLRRRRRLAVTGASAATVLALLVGGSMLTRLGDGPIESAPVASASSTGVLGEVIDTGFRSDGEPVLLWFVPIEDAMVPGTAIGLTTGRRTARGTLERLVLMNETEGSSRSPGFHSPHVATEVDGYSSPAFGYFVGTDVVRITAVADGNLVEARFARWSNDPSVVAFWFDPAQVPAERSLTKLTAYDADGRALPSRDVGFGTG
ncbi:hypothetical protein AB0M36_02925 [Actinoplanes sp. NPDC051346]|uniref:hypothetical protein n=1 Tax=Actinoplanes sp. NPDC051346 TaxID=3155048 RepID=UPI003415F77A